MELTAAELFLIWFAGLIVGFILAFIIDLK